MSGNCRTGRVLYHFYIDDELALRVIRFEYDEEGNKYYIPVRALVTEKRWEGDSPADNEKCLDVAEEVAWAEEQGVEREITRVWYGRGEDAILLWEEGMDLPAASEADEAAGAMSQAAPPIGRIAAEKRTLLCRNNRHQKRACRHCRQALFAAYIKFFVDIFDKTERETVFLHRLASCAPLPSRGAYPGWGRTYRGLLPGRLPWSDIPAWHRSSSAVYTLPPPMTQI